MVIQGEDTFAFEGLGDGEDTGDLPESRSVDRQKTVSKSDHHLSIAYLTIIFLMLQRAGRRYNTSALFYYN